MNVAVFYEPNALGFARWTIEERVDIRRDQEIGSATADRSADVVMTREIATGWWRPPSGWTYQELPVRPFGSYYRIARVTTE